MKVCKLNVIALGLSIGVLWAVMMFIVGLLSYYADYGTAFIMAINSLYLIKEITIGNVIIGTLVGFVDGFIGGVVIAYLYNLFGGNNCNVDK